MSTDKDAVLNMIDEAIAPDLPSPDQPLAPDPDDPPPVEAAGDEPPAEPPADPPDGDEPPAEPPPDQDDPSEPKTSEPDPETDAPEASPPDKKDAEPVETEGDKGGDESQGEDKDDSLERPSDKFGALPKDSKQETAERFEKLRGGYDEIHGELEAANQRIDDMVAVVQRTGASPEQFDATLRYIGARNSGNPANIEKAYNVIKQEFEEVSKMLGKPVPGSDPLEGHDDLLQELESGEISRARAEEIAAGRAKAKLQDDFLTGSAEEKSHEQRLNDAYTDIASLGVEWRKNSAAKYASNEQALIQIMRTIENSDMDPSEWAANLKRAFDELPDASAPPAPTPSPTPDPIRPGGANAASAGLSKEPGTAVEAMNQALGL